jgi:5-methylthioadenosine/S-adenosylhomocysteine deaminase
MKSTPTAMALCAKYGVPLVTHLSETAREVDESHTQRQDTPIGYANRVGAFSVPCIAAHCVHATPKISRLLASMGVGVAPCPTSNLKLASGVAPYLQFLQAGVRTGLGTDGPASNDDQDMFSEIHLAALLPKGLSGNPTAMPARTAFALATSSGRGGDSPRRSHRIARSGQTSRASWWSNSMGSHSTPHYTYAPMPSTDRLVSASRAGDVRDVIVAVRVAIAQSAIAHPRRTGDSP